MQFVVQSGTEPGKTYDLGPNGKITIGRQSANDVVVSDEQVSRRHAEVTATSNGVVVTDLGSSNGTFVNGTRVSTPQTIRPNDTVQVGTTVLRMVDSQNVANTMPAGYDQPAPSNISNSNNYPQAAAAQSPNYGNYSPPATPDNYGSNAPAGQAGGNYAQPNYGQAAPQPTYTPAPVQPNYGTPYTPVSAPNSYAPAGGGVAKKGAPIALIIGIAAVVAILIIGAILFFVLGGSKAGGSIAAPANSTKLNISMDDFKSLEAKTNSTVSAKIDYSKLSIDSYRTKDNPDIVGNNYRDQLKKDGWVLDATKSSSNGPYFTKDKNAVAITIGAVTTNNLDGLQKDFPNAKDQIKVGDTFVLLVQGPTDVLQPLVNS